MSDLFTLIQNYATQATQTCSAIAARKMGDAERSIREEERIWLDIESAFKASIRRARVETLRDAAGGALNGSWPEGFFPGVAGVARELEARAIEIEASL